MKNADDWFQAGMRAVERSRGADHHSELVSDLEEALEHFDRALALQADHAEALAHKGLVLAQLERHHAADPVLAAAIARNPDQAHLWRARGRTLASLGHQEAALGAWDAALRLQPHDADTLFHRALSLDALGRDAQALAAWDAMLHAPDGRTVHLPLQSVHVLTGDVMHLRALLRRALVLARLQRTEEARAAFAQALDAGARELHGPGAPTEFHTALGSSEEARAAYRAYLQAHADDATTWQCAGQAYLISGRALDALAAYEQVLQLAPDDARGWFGKAEALVQAGRSHDAVAAYQRSLEKDPGFLGAAARLRVLRDALVTTTAPTPSPSVRWRVMGHDTFARKDFVVRDFDSRSEAEAWIEARERANEKTQDEALRDRYWIDPSP